jgi:hypothetical protein
VGTQIVWEWGYRECGNGDIGSVLWGYRECGNGDIRRVGTGI